jgi:hypothetical protein
MDNDQSRIVLQTRDRKIERAFVAESGQAARELAKAWAKAEKARQPDSEGYWNHEYEPTMGWFAHLSDWHFEIQVLDPDCKIVIWSEHAPQRDESGAFGGFGPGILVVS